MCLILLHFPPLESPGHFTPPRQAAASRLRVKPHASAGRPNPNPHPHSSVLSVRSRPSLRSMHLRGKKAERARLRNMLSMSGVMEGGGVAGLANMRAMITGGGRDQQILPVTEKELLPRV